ncbi:MAG: choice-of-anchor D domain-containing protein [Candidatus Methanomethylicaceae archaeon]
MKSKLLATWLLSIFAVALIATATNIARMTLTTDGPLDFGNVLLGAFVDRTVTIRNDGSADLTGTVTTAAPFALVGDGGPFTVKPGAMYVLTVRCAPTSIGTFRSTLEIGDTNDPNASNKTITLLCNGIGPKIAILSSEVVNFGEVVVGSSADQDLIIRNAGTENLKGTVNAPGSPFSLLRGEGVFDIPPGRTYTVTVRCTPTNRGFFRATVEIRGINDAIEPSKTIILHCTGIGPEITLLPDDTGLGSGPHLTLDFGAAVVNQAKDVSFEIRNDGERPLRGTVNAPTLNPPFSLVSGGGNFTVNPGMTHSVIVRCQLRTQGGSTGTLTITTINDTDEPTKMIALICGKAIPDIDVTPLSIDFGSQSQGTSSSRIISIKNTGSAPLRLTHASIRFNVATFKLITNIPQGCKRFPCIVMPDQTVEFEVQATPRANQFGVVVGTLRIMSNDPDERIVDVPLQVTVTPQTSSADLTVAINNLEIYQTKHTLEFKITGTGILEVHVALYDLRGRKITEVSSESGQVHLEALDYQGKPLANGVYFYVITYKGADGTVLRDRIKKLVLLR